MREREPSQIKMKTIINLLKKKKSRDKFKKMVLKYVPVSSILYKVATYFNHWKMKCIRKENSFYSSHFYAFKVKGERYYVAKRKVPLSSDVELNPGPMFGNTIKTVSFTNQNFVLRYRMLRHGLQPLENSTDREHEKSGEHIHLSPNSKRQNRAAYMKEYRKATDSPEKRAKLNENKRNRRAALNIPEKKAKRNAVRSRRATLISPERKAKRNAYDRHRRAVLKGTNTSVDVSVKNVS